jgi:hypothetical protein
MIVDAVARARRRRRLRGARDSTRRAIDLAGGRTSVSDLRARVGTRDRIALRTLGTCDRSRRSGSPLHQLAPSPHRPRGANRYRRSRASSSSRSPSAVRVSTAGSEEHMACAASDDESLSSVQSFFELALTEHRVRSTLRCALRGTRDQADRHVRSRRRWNARASRYLHHEPIARAPRSLHAADEHVAAHESRRDHGTSAFARHTGGGS